MTYALIIKPEAEADITAANEWYLAIGEELSRRFLETLETVLRRMQSTPLLYAVEKWECRRAHLRKFPYFLVYRVEGNNVVVLGLFHERRDPALWQTRARDTSNGQDHASKG
jgi:plasmid stabilization system protein ParE